MANSKRKTCNEAMAIQHSQILLDKNMWIAGLLRARQRGRKGETLNVCVN